MVDYVKVEEEEKKETPQKKKKFKFSFKKLLLMFLVIFLLSSIISSISYSLTPKLAVVPIDGAILTSSQSSLLSGSSLSSRDIADRLNTIKSDDSIKAVILDINSPGGSPVASEEIGRAIESLREVKPVYALINDVGASGAYWIAVEAEQIYASSMSTVGSIGVTSAGLSFEDFIRDYNITYRRQVAGEHKDMGSIFREPTPEEEEKIQAILDEVHMNFINQVAENRNLSVEHVTQFATGEIFLGSTALENGFIDKIGYYPDVVNDLKNKTQSELMIVEYRPSTSFIQTLGLDTLFNRPDTSTNNQILLK